MNEVLTFSFGNTQVLSGMYASKHVAERLANKNRKKVPNSGQRKMSKVWYKSRKYVESCRGNYTNSLTLRSDCRKKHLIFYEQ